MPLSSEQLIKVLPEPEDAVIYSRSKGLPAPMHRGKVRDTYDLGDNRLLIVVSDRLSTFDVVHPNGVGGRGIILTQMTLFWLQNHLQDIVPNHLISTNRRDFPAPFASRPELAHRSMMVEKLEMLPYECIVRGNITGSAWKEYSKNGTILGQPFTPGLLESQKFDEPIFTPSTKAETGHDENISFERMANEAGLDLATKMRDISLEVYTKAANFALAKGIIIADTKFEYGLDKNGQLVLGDEVLTPDSSRFWPLRGFVVGQSQPSLDKQSVRDWAEDTGWNKRYPAPKIPPQVIGRTHAKYFEAYQKLCT